MLRKIASILGIAVAIIGLALFNGLGKQAAKAAFTPGKPTPEQIQSAIVQGLEKAARQINERGSIMVDEDTRMDGASVGPGARMTYLYTLPKHSSLEIDAAWMKTNVQPIVRKNMCSKPAVVSALKDGVTYIYSYSGSDGVKIVNIEITQRDCGA
jgi:hypothetical protein